MSISKNAPDDRLETLELSNLLRALGHSETDRLVVCHQPVSGQFAARSVTGSTAAASHVDGLPIKADVWFGVNSRRPNLLSGHKGKAEQVEDLVALWADLDIAEDKCPDGTTAHAIIDHLAELLGTRPVAVVFSGHGWQPYWRLSDEVPEDFGTVQAKALVSRWGSLVAAIASDHGATVDNVYSLDRIMRVPGTLNCKDPAFPVETYALADTGTPVAIATVEKVCDERLGTPPGNDGSKDVVPEEIFSRAALVARIEKSPAGQRNNTLFGAVKDAVKQGDWTPSVKAALETAARKVGLPDGETTTTIASASKGVELAPDQSLDKLNAVLGGGENGCAEQAFWESSPQLHDLRQFARARMIGPWAMLGNVLARVVAHIPPHVVLPPTIGSHASLNLFVGVVGRSGDTKSASMAAASSWLKVQPDYPPAKPGSGEGLAKCFATVVKLPANQGGGYEQRGRQWSVLAKIPEVDTLTATAARGGATIMSTLREGWSGERLGTDYAADEKRITLQEHRYRLCLVMGVQPGRAQALFDDADGGTPQRILWLPSIDPDAPEDDPDEPPPLRLGRWEPTTNAVVDRDTNYNRQLADEADADEFDVLTIPACARAQVRAQRDAVRRGDQSVDPLDGHKLLLRLKVASALMALEGRRHDITEDDWNRAEVIMAVSDRTRNQVLDALLQSKIETNHARGRFDGERAEIAEQIKTSRTVERVAKNLLGWLQKSGASVTRAEARRHFHSRDREWFDDAEQLLIDDAVIDKTPTDNSGPDGFMLALAQPSSK